MDADAFTGLGNSVLAVTIPTYEEHFNYTAETTTEDGNEARKQVPSLYSNSESLEEVQTWSKSGQSAEIKGLLTLESLLSTPQRLPPQDRNELFTGRKMKERKEMLMMWSPTSERYAFTETEKSTDNFALDLDDRGDNLAATRRAFEQRAHKNRRCNVRGSFSSKTMNYKRRKLEKGYIEGE